MNWFRSMFVCSAALSLLAMAGVAFGADLPPDAEKSEVWQKVRKSYFEDRVIINDADGKVVALKAPTRAEDAATVPIQIKTGLSQTRDRYIQKLYLFIDANPSPVAAIFTFTPESGRADIDTRVRIEAYSHLRAVAEMNDGKLYMSTHYIKASGGCSAANGTLPDYADFKPKLKFKVDPNVEKGQPTLAQLLINHPNASPLVRDQISNLYQQAYYVRTVNVSYGGKLIMTADVDFSISENPNFRFYFMPQGEGELRAEVLDTRDVKVESFIKITPGSGST
ncbi:MAG: quinoprotein dehydrogenase-associated SoxYZ-like carrier [Burkholderiales bacterium]